MRGDRTPGPSSRSVAEIRWLLQRWGLTLPDPCWENLARELHALVGTARGELTADSKNPAPKHRC
jgi:hypothetical protein